VHSATRPEISSPTFGASGRGLGFRFLFVFLLSMMVQNRGAPHRDIGGFHAGGGSCFFHTAGSQPPSAGHCCCGRCTTAYNYADIPDSVEGCFEGVVCGQGVVAPPPSSTASPGAMKQWRDDVNRLLSMAHSGLTRSRPQSPRRQHEATTSVHSPLVRGAQTNDLRAKLNRRSAGEDARVSLERAWVRRQNFEGHEDARVSLERARERWLNIKGRNLNQDFAAVAPQTPIGARFQAGVPLAGVGCAALADHLCAAT
jgi:hypothetical protein